MGVPDGFLDCEYEVEHRLVTQAFKLYETKLKACLWVRYSRSVTGSSEITHTSSLGFLDGEMDHRMAVGGAAPVAGVRGEPLGASLLLQLCASGG